MSNTYNTLLFSTDEQGIATITINRPDKLNALNNELLNELAAAFEEVNTDDDIRGCIVTGAGEKAFVAGADIKELQKLDEEGGRGKSRQGQQVFQAIEDTRKPVIALINGYALGGGAELAMACHLRIGTRKAVFGLPEVGLGLIPGYGGTQRLPAIVGKAKALELILTGKHLSAQQAHSFGLLNTVVPEEDGLEEAAALMQEILKNGPLAIQRALEAVYQSGDDSDYKLEAELFGKLCDTRDAKEGTSAFLEKRSPDFKGK